MIEKRRAQRVESKVQERLRENIKALTSTAEAKQLIARYVSKANEQETRLSSWKLIGEPRSRNAHGYRLNWTQ